VRIYDLAKKLGIESKLVLAKAKELGCAAAKVPSSTLDKITADYLEQQLESLYPSAMAISAREALALAEAAKLRREIADKEAELQEKTVAWESALAAKSKTDAQVQDIVKRLNELLKESATLQKKKDLGYLLDHVCPAAAELLLKDVLFLRRFEEAETCPAFVLSIDIRRSTDLMLRAGSPGVFADFLSATCSKLFDEIKSNYGVVDKFTGDGLLAYFPDFFSGLDAGYRALAVAQACHKAFAELYRAERHRFSVALKDVGLGIGIDFGPIQFWRVSSEISVVGAPVVYACRFSGAPVGRTYMNHSAVAELEKRCPKAFSCEEVEFEIKHEGLASCQNVVLTDIRYIPDPPDWLTNSPAPVGSDSTKSTPAQDIAVIPG
jgi:class 3 adenylate cyclase